MARLSSQRRGVAVLRCEQHVVDSQDSLDLDRPTFACGRFVAPPCEGSRSRPFERCTWASNHLADSWKTVRANPYIHDTRSFNPPLKSVWGILRGYALDTSIWHGVHASGFSRN